MKMLMFVTIPHEPFNSAVRDGTAAAKMKKILDACKPEVAYFTEQDGTRGGILVVDVADPSKVPGLAEPWFLTFNADVKLRIAMNAADLNQANLEEIGKKWR
jgi:hypothetical protein